MCFRMFKSYHQFFSVKLYAEVIVETDNLRNLLNVTVYSSTVIFFFKLRSLFC